MAYIETPELPQAKALPQVMVGAVSPLWAYFGAAAVGGVAFWWMTRWARPVNLEAMFETVAPALEAAEAIAAVPPAIVEAAAELAVEAAPPLPLVTEAMPALAAASDAPIVEAVAEPAPVVEAAPEPEPVVEAVAEPEPVLDAAPEPTVEAAAEPYTWAEPEVTASFEEPAAEPAPKARKAKAAPAPEATPEA